MPFLGSRIFVDDEDRMNQHGVKEMMKIAICDDEQPIREYLKKLTESKVEKISGTIVASPLDESKPFEVDDHSMVSMNFLLFTPTIFLIFDSSKYVDGKIFTPVLLGTLYSIIGKFVLFAINL